MQQHTILTICVFSLFSSSTAAPFTALPRAGASACTAEPLTQDTWTSLNIDSFLANWAAANVTVTSTNNVQSLAASFGAPNFFCGLDEFCNAGQPCLPVQLPAWYALVAIQNWNNYMNSLNTAIEFASSIVGLTLPGIVNDFFPKPVDNVTPLETIGKVFTTALGIVPFTGALKTAAGAISGGINFVSGVVKPPAEPNLFVDWSDIATSTAKLIQDYQSAVSSAVTNILNAPVNSTGGINSILAGGGFLGISQNFTQADIQAEIINSTNVLAISLTLQAQKMFVFRTKGTGPCQSSSDTGIGNSQLCVDGGSSVTNYLLTQGDSNGNANNLDSVADLLINKYGISQQEFLVGPANCKDQNGGSQLTDPFNGTIPLDPTTTCLFNLIVCEDTIGDATNIGIVEDCQNQGLDV